MPDNLHAERLCAPGNLQTNLAQSDYAQSLPAKFGSLERFLLPLSRVHEPVRAGKQTRHAQHHPQGQLGHRYRVGAGRVHDCDALARGGVEIDVVHADTRAAYNPQLRCMLEQRGIDLHRRAHDQRVGRFQLRSQFAFDLIMRDHSPPRFAQQVHRGGRYFFGDDDFHCWLSSLKCEIGTTRPGLRRISKARLVKVSTHLRPNLIPIWGLRPMHRPDSFESGRTPPVARTSWGPANRWNSSSPRSAYP